MTSLNQQLLDYLEGPAKQIRADIQSTRSLAERSVSLLQYAVSKRIDGWIPYVVDSDDSASTATESASTNLMVAHALACVSPNVDKRELQLLSETRALTFNVDEARRQLVAPLANGNLKSKTFGLNHPLLLCWWSDLGEPMPDVNWRTFDHTGEPIGSATRDDENRDATVDETRAFCRLRRFQARIAAGVNAPTDVMKYGNTFLSCLHDHLSFKVIPDSRFDPAELAFNLEGALLAESKQGPGIEQATLEAAVTTLCDVQARTSNWRPTRPFVHHKNGTVLFPVSVEVANSLLRTLTLCKHRLSDDYRSRIIDALRTYLRWLQTRAVVVGDLGTGWHSEHVNKDRLVHVWETSQVLLFLARLHSELLSLLADAGLRLAAISAITPPAQDLETSVSFFPAFDHAARLEKFVGDSTKPKPDDAKSVLLYGPPGTGKTTAAKWLAHRLGRRLISISVSDFVGAGAEVERRAKALFEVLELQDRSVILFDEIDHLLLDRSSLMYARMDTVFQFLTPGMLTKLQDLRTRGEAIFAIATNYEWRIDAAIKRDGRIDEAILILPPDKQRRRQMFAGAGTPEPDLDSLVTASIFLTEYQVKRLAKKRAPLSDVCDKSRAATLASYRILSDELKGREPSAHTLREVLGMMYLWWECQPDDTGEVDKAYRKEGLGLSELLSRSGVVELAKGFGGNERFSKFVERIAKP